MKYGILTSVRRQSKRIHELINDITAKVGESIEWHPRTHYHNIKLLGSQNLIYFRMRGNVYVKRLELLSYDLDILSQIKEELDQDFKTDIEVKDGILY